MSVRRVILALILAPFIVGAIAALGGYRDASACDHAREAGARLALPGDPSQAAAWRYVAEHCQ